MKNISYECVVRVVRMEIVIKRVDRYFFCENFCLGLNRKLKFGVLSQIQVTADHKVYFGDTTPKLIISRNNQLYYRNFDFFMQMRSWSGHDVCNQFSMYNGIIKRVGQNLIKPLYEMHKDLKGNKLITDIL